MKFLLSRGNHIHSPAALNRNRERLGSELDALTTASGVPVVRFRRGECKEDIARPFQDAAAAEGRWGLVLVGEAQERRSSWRGFVDPSHAGHRPNHPHIAGRRQSSVPRPQVPVLLRPRVGAGLPEAVLLGALPALGLRQRAPMGQARAGQGGDRLRGLRQRAAIRE